jgi:hypothetical protein
LQVVEMVAAVESLFLPSTFRVGLHIRMGGNWFDQADQGAVRHQNIPARVAICAVATLPWAQRERPVTYVLISDKSDSKQITRYVITLVKLRIPIRARSP